MGDLISFCRDDQGWTRIITYHISSKCFCFCLAHELEIHSEGTLENVGSVFVRIEPKSILPANIMDTRRDVSSLQVDLQAASISRPGKIEESRPVRTLEAGQSVLTELDGFSALKSLCGRLEKLDLETIKPFIEMVDELSQVSYFLVCSFHEKKLTPNVKVHQYAEAAWKIVRSVYTVSSYDRVSVPNMYQLKSLRSYTKRRKTWIKES